MTQETEPKYKQLTALEMGNIADRYGSDFEMIQAVVISKLMDISINEYAKLDNDDPERMEAEDELNDQLDDVGEIDVTDEGWTITLPRPMKNKGREITEVSVRFPTKAGDRLSINAPARSRLTDHARNRYKVANLCDLPLPVVNTMPIGAYYCIVRLIDEYITEVSNRRNR